MAYVVKRIAKHYPDGTTCPEQYFKGIPLGIMVELTKDAKEAKQFARKSEATAQAKALGRNYYVSKLEA